MAALDRALRWIRRLPPLAIDSALAGAILLAGIVDLAVLTHRSSFPPGVPVRFGTLPYLLMTLWVGSLAFRRMNLAAVFAISVGTTIIGLVLLTVDQFTVAWTIAQVVLVFSVAYQWPLSWALVALLVEYVINVAFVLFIYAKWFDSSAYGQFQPYFYWTILFGMVFFAGRVARRRRCLADELTGLNAELAVEQARLTQQAVSSERRRIARDLQALVLQRVEDAARQIEIASKQLRSDPPRATETIEGIEASGRATVVEMGRVLSLIRATNEDAADGAGAMPAGGQP